MENKKQVTIVSDDYRTNELSLVPGGHTVEFHYENKINIYKNIKNPHSYISKLSKQSKNEILKILVDGNIVNLTKK